jgi:isoquinoline 1-oxidoreductase alpha subunit
LISFILNGKSTRVEATPDTPLLWVLRDELGLTGSKYACGMAQCGACTVHVDGSPQRACVLPVSAAANRSVQTIEGLDDKVGLAVQKAWQDLNVVQCGYCQSGQIMSATALLRKNSKPSVAEIESALDGNLCRCATYFRIKQAIVHAAKILET